MAPEIITLQLGSYANYVGAHFWNLQVHYDCPNIHVFLRLLGSEVVCVC
jgi:hypothetical protein